jgi:drug/metabolite transporter (DMT)-like permease
MRDNKYLVYFAILFATLFWGFSFIWTKEVLRFYPPITIVFLRLIISSIILITVGKLLKKIQKLKTKDIKTMLLLSLLQPFLYFIGESIGLTYVTSTIAAVIISTIPLFCPLASYIFYRERVSPMNFIGIVVSVFGVGLVILKDDFSFVASTVGILFLLMAVLAAIAYSIVAKRITEIYNVYSIITYQNSIGILFFLPIFLYSDFQTFITTAPTIDAIIPLLELSFFASSLAFIFFTYGIKKIGIIRTNSFTNIVPVFTSVFAYFILDETLIIRNIIGIVIVILGLSLSQIKLPKRKQRKFRFSFYGYRIINRNPRKKYES